MNPKILIVDDDPDILRGYTRSLRKFITIDTALGGEPGLEAIRNKGPYSVVISDLRMPGMDGIEFLTKVFEESPNTVRMMLSGDADLSAAAHAVNEGKIFQFMQKPCPVESLKQAIKSGLSQYQLIIAEKELIEKTLKGSIKILTDVLALVNPVAFGKASRISGYVKNIIKVIKPVKSWQFDIATMLSQIGCVALPVETVEKAFKGQQLNSDELEMFNNHCQIGHDLVTNIPRFEEIAEIISYQNKQYNGEGSPEDSVKENDLPLGSRILKVAIDYDLLVSNGCSPQNAVIQLQGRDGWYDPDILNALLQNLESDAETIRYNATELYVDKLRLKMILNQDVFNRNGVMLIGKGNEITKPLQKMLENLNKFNKVDDKIKVLVPVS